MRQACSAPTLTGKNTPLSCFPGIFHIFHCSQAFMRSISFCSPTCSSLDRVLKIARFYFFLLLYFFNPSLAVSFSFPRYSWRESNPPLSRTEAFCLRRAVLLPPSPGCALLLQGKPPPHRTPSAQTAGNDARMCNEISEMRTDFLEICQPAKKMKKK